MKTNKTKRTEARKNTCPKCGHNIEAEVSDA